MMEARAEFGAEIVNEKAYNRYQWKTRMGGQ